MQFGVKNINDKIKSSAVVGIGKVLFSNENDLLYFMISALINQTNNEFSSQSRLSIIHRNIVGNFLVSTEFNFKEGESSISYEWQKQFTKNYSLFLKKYKDKNSVLGVNYYF